MGAKKMQTSGTTCRENADTHSLVIPATGSAEWPPDVAGMTADEWDELEQQLNLFHRRKTGYACAAH
jgi:hypothetical protein